MQSSSIEKPGKAKEEGSPKKRDAKEERKESGTHEPKEEPKPKPKAKSDPIAKLKQTAEDQVEEVKEILKQVTGKGDRKHERLASKTERKTPIEDDDSRMDGHVPQLEPEQIRHEAEKYDMDEEDDEEEPELEPEPEREPEPEPEPDQDQEPEAEQELEMEQESKSLKRNMKQADYDELRSESKSKRQRLGRHLRETRKDETKMSIMGGRSGGLTPAQAKKEAQLQRLKPGDRIAIYWPMEKAHYSGTLVQESSPGQWLIQYDDGDLRLHALHNDHWQFRLPDKGEKGSPEESNWKEGEAVPEINHKQMNGEHRSNDERPRTANSVAPASAPVSNEDPEAPPEHLVASWGKKFERTKYAALCEARILLGLIQSVTPTEPQLATTMTDFARRLRDMTAFCSSLRENQNGEHHENGEDFMSTDKLKLKVESKANKAPIIPPTSSRSTRMDSKPRRQSTSSQERAPLNRRMAPGMAAGMAPGMPGGMPPGMYPGMHPGMRNPSMHASQMMMHEAPMHPQQSVYGMPSQQRPSQRMPYPGQYMGMKMRPYD
mmetsp:Transcript_6496/g.8983  ORF Transcript_6496/g.8983 Transcript_6496/m.8983 type:complete len:547 (+) Transcript_6496:182-1822(+)